MSSKPDSAQEKAPVRIIPRITPRCTLCGDCLPTCPTKSIFVAGAQAVIDTDTCHGCHVCVAVCKERALVDGMGAQLLPGQVGADTDAD